MMTMTLEAAGTPDTKHSPHLRASNPLSAHLPLTLLEATGRWTPSLLCKLPPATCTALSIDRIGGTTYDS